MSQNMNEEVDDYKTISKSAELEVTRLTEKFEQLRKWMTYSVAAMFTLVILGGAFIVQWSRLTTWEMVQDNFDALERLEDQTKKVLSQRFREFPVGTIVPILTISGPPQGWLPCDGRRITRDEYPDLHDILKSIFTETNEIRIPDLTDTFINRPASNGTSPAMSKIRIFWFIKAE